MHNPDSFSGAIITELRLLAAMAGLVFYTTLAANAQPEKTFSITVDGSYTFINLVGLFKFGLRNPPIPVKQSNGQYDTIYDYGEGNMDMTGTRSSGFRIGLRASQQLNF